MRERLKRVVLKTTELQKCSLVTGWKEQNQLRISPEESGDCSKTVVAGEVAERLMAPVLKTGIP
jgi:hypothetical protein